MPRTDAPLSGDNDDTSTAESGYIQDSSCLMLQPELRCCDYAKATARHRRRRTSVPLFLVRRLRVDEHNVLNTCGFGSEQDATGSDLDLWMPQTNASSIPHSLDVAPVDLTTFDPARSPVHHSVTPRAQLLKPAASSRAGGVERREINGGNV